LFRELEYRTEAVCGHQFGAKLGEVTFHGEGRNCFAPQNILQGNWSGQSQGRSDWV